MANVQIPEELFMNLVKYHLCGINELDQQIKKGLQEKLDNMARHDLYSKYKTAATAEEKEKARREYLEKKGIPDKFRW